MLLRLLTGILIALFSVGSVMADEIADKAKSAADLAAAGKFEEAIDTLEGVKSVLWDRSPLLIRHAMWVAEMPSGYGAYTVRATDV